MHARSLVPVLRQRSLLHANIRAVQLRHACFHDSITSRKLFVQQRAVRLVVSDIRYIAWRASLQPLVDQRQSRTVTELRLDADCSLSHKGGSLAGQLGTIRDVQNCTIDAILQQSSSLIESPAGLLLGSLQPHPLGMNLASHYPIPVWFVDPYTATEIMSSVARIQMTPLPVTEAINLTEGVKIPLRTNIVVHTGRRLTIQGADSTILPGQFQFSVQRGGVLEISNATISGSSKTPAIKTEGITELWHTVMQDNHEYDNFWSGVSGAAVLVMPGGALSTASTSFKRNMGNMGSCIFCTRGSTLRLQDTELSNNHATHGGGAIAAIGGCSIIFLGHTTISNNNARYYSGALLAEHSSIIFDGRLYSSGNTASGGVVEGRAGGTGTHAQVHGCAMRMHI